MTTRRPYTYYIIVWRCFLPLPLYRDDRVITISHFDDVNAAVVLQKITRALGGFRFSFFPSSTALRTLLPTARAAAPLTKLYHRVSFSVVVLVAISVCATMTFVTMTRGAAPSGEWRERHTAIFWSIRRARFTHVPFTRFCYLVDASSAAPIWARHAINITV